METLLEVLALVLLFLIHDKLQEISIKLTKPERKKTENKALPTSENTL